MAQNLTNIEIPMHMFWQIFPNIFVLAKFGKERHRAHQVVHDCGKLHVGNIPFLAELSELMLHRQFVINHIKKEILFLPHYRCNCGVMTAVHSRE